jgi:hypothetical protein
MKKERLLELAGITEAYDPYTALDDALHNVASALVNIAVKEAKGDKRKVKSNFISLVQDVQEQIRGFAGPMLVGELKESELTTILEGGVHGVYRKSKAQIDSDDGHTAARSALVKRGGEHVTFKSKGQAEKWIEDNSKGEEMFVRKVSKTVTEGRVSGKDHSKEFDATKKVLLAKLADAYIKMAQREAKDEVAGHVEPDPNEDVKYWTEDFIDSWMADVQKLLPQEFEAAVNKLWK